ncbi:MAG: PcfJ domain-containing protein [Hyphomicrobium sp.]|nr:PcfJ domain-containing protein [Hyphomicrobium sp.]
MTRRAPADRLDGLRLTRRSPAEVQGMIARFDAPARVRLAEFVSRHPYIEDLMWSFPAAAHQLALDASFGDDYLRAKLVEAGLFLVTQGAPLTAISAGLSLPLWLRRLPPEAFRGPIPELPMDVSFGPRVANHMPTEVAMLSRWLRWIAAANAAADADYAIWAAKIFQPVNERGISGVGALGLFAWASGRPDVEIGADFEERFEMDLSLASAIDRAHTWLNRLAFVVFDAPRLALAGPRMTVDGYTFVPLETPDDFITEGRLMGNCVAECAELVADGSRQIWSVRSADGQRVANIEVRLRAGSGGVPYMAQAHGPRNCSIPGPCLRAVYAWLLEWPQQVGDLRERVVAASPATCAVYRRLMMPYWREKGLMPWCPLNPAYDPFGEFRDCLALFNAQSDRRRHAALRRRRRRFQRR